MTFDDVAKGDGKNGNQVLLALNGKVIHINENHPMINIYRRAAGNHLEIFAAKMLYEPLYGAP